MEDRELAVLIKITDIQMQSQLWDYCCYLCIHAVHFCISYTGLVWMVMFSSLLSYASPPQLVDIISLWFCHVFLLLVLNKVDWVNVCLKRTVQQHPGTHEAFASRKNLNFCGSACTLRACYCSSGCSAFRHCLVNLDAQCCACKHGLVWGVNLSLYA